MRPSISVLVRDAATDAYIGSGATLVLTDGAFVDSASHPAVLPSVNEYPLTTPNSGERAGTYDVIVRRAGYDDWHRNDVVVTQGRCHVRTVSLTARLTPSAAP